MTTNTRLGRAHPDQRRATIMAVATAVFMEEGYAATAMSTISDRLGGSKATLYKYFPSKEELFEAVMAESCAVALAPIHDLPTPGEDLEVALRAYGRRALRAMFTPQALGLHRIVHAEGERFPHIARMFFAIGPDRGYAPLADYFREAHDRGEVQCPAPLLTAQQFLAMLRGDLHMRVACGAAPIPDDAEIDAQVENAVTLFVRGLGASPSPSQPDNDAGN